jgi:hypothetical protein
MIILRVNIAFCTGTLFIVHKWCNANSCCFPYRREYTKNHNLFWVYPILGLKFESNSIVHVAIIQVNQKYFYKKMQN